MLQLPGPDIPNLEIYPNVYMSDLLIADRSGPPISGGAKPHHHRLSGFPDPLSLPVGPLGGAQLEVAQATTPR